jgi:hypothetical protein
MEASEQDKQIRRIESTVGARVYPRSLVNVDRRTFVLVRGSSDRWLVVWGDPAGLSGERHGDLLQCPLSAANARTMRELLPWLRPQPLGTRKAVGCGDRLGLATPGHIRALRAAPGVSPVLAQQSMRENARTGRTPQEVLDDAMWGAFQEGWRGAWGADADHLKTVEAIDRCAPAGYTFYTFDPGDWVDNSAHQAPAQALQAKYQCLPWANLDDTPDGLSSRYLGRDWHIEGIDLRFDEITLMRAAAKYGPAVQHVARLYRNLARALPGRDVDVEISVDETDTPTSPLEHLYVSLELRRLGVQWVSLAPRYIGRFEKGVDYLGDLDPFESEFAQHAALARALGPYKLSLHSGSDKFTIYPIVARHAGELVHLKTAGTSYLEALRAVARTDPLLFGAILDFARERYSTDRQSYHVSAAIERVPASQARSAGAMPALLDAFDARQVLHVTFGAVLDRFGAQLRQVLWEHEEAHYAALDKHFRRHLAPFALPPTGGQGAAQNPHPRRQEAQ